MSVVSCLDEIDGTTAASRSLAEGTLEMKVLVVGINYAPEPTGSAPYTTRIAEGLAGRGHDVRVLTTFPHYPQWRVAPDSGFRRCELVGSVPVSRVRHYVPRTPVGARRALSEVSFGFQAVTSKWHAPDVVVCSSPALISSALVQLRRSGAFGLQIQDLYSAGLAEIGGGDAVTRAMTRLEARVARSADGVAVIHKRFKRLIEEDLGVPARRIRVIRNWTHLRKTNNPDIAQTRCTLGWGDEFVVLHAGAMGEKQALSNVVDAAKAAHAQALPVRFVLLGDGGQRRELERLGAGVQSLQFIDPLPETAYVQALHAADALLVNERPGVKEMAVPSKLTSYFSTGRPVIAATGAGSTTADELAASGAGMRVDPGDPLALVSGVRSLRDDPGMASRIGGNGPLYCERVLSEPAALEAYEEWIHELVHRYRTR